MRIRRILIVGLILVMLTLACNLPLETTQTQEPGVAETVPVEAPGDEPSAEEPPVQDNTQPSLQIESTEYQPGAAIRVDFTAPASYPPHAWIGMVLSSTPHNDEAENDSVHLQMEPIDGRTAGTALFNAPQDPGSYDIRMFDSDENGQEVASVTFSVAAAQQAAEPDVRCSGISFSFDDSLAANARCVSVDAYQGSPDSPEWEINPAHTVVEMEGYLLQNTFHDARIFVFPVAEYESMSERARDIIANLRNLLSNQPQAPEHIPFLPLFNAAQMLRSNVQYMDFQNGSGVRFLTQYGQAAYPVNNESLFYSFQGLSDDGQFYVAAIFPVNHPDLPAKNDDVPNGDWDAFYNNFETYIVDIQIELSGKPANTFTPNLDLLDALVQGMLLE